MWVLNHRKQSLQLIYLKARVTVTRKTESEINGML